MNHQKVIADNRQADSLVHNDTLANWQTDAIMVVESLRAGIPTRLSTRKLPDLRQHVTDRIMRDLDVFESGSIPTGRLIWGQYGQGKTHALTAIEHQALDRNFAVSRISLNREVSCHNLFNLYGQLAPRIRTPASTLEGIQRYLNKIHPADIQQSNLFQEDRYDNLLPRIILEDGFYAEGEDKEKLYGDLTGVRLPAGEINRIHRSVKGSAMPKLQFKVTEHAGSYFGVMADMLQLCGFEGWVILIDEIELIGRLGKLARLKAYRNLHWLLNWGGAQKYPIYTVAAAATRLQDDLWYGKTNDDRSIMPELAMEKFGESDSRDMERFFKRAAGPEALNILPAQNADLELLLARVAQLHGQAYEWQPEFSSAELIRHLGSQPVRTYVRAMLESLDLQMLYGQQQIPDTVALSETVMAEDETGTSESGVVKVEDEAGTSKAEW